MPGPRVIIGLLGIDQHEVAAVAVAGVLRDAGMEVVYAGRYNTPASFARIALAEDADVIGISCHSWEYLHYVPELMALIAQDELDVAVVLGGSVITPADAAAMRAAGVAAVFGPDATPDRIVHEIRALAGARHERVKPGRDPAAPAEGPTMPYETILYETRERVAIVTLNRPEKFNTIRAPMHDEVERAIAEANRDRDVRVILLQGSGTSFCAGFDFSGGLAHFDEFGIPTKPGEYDPGKDMLVALDPWMAPTQKFMAIWKSPKPVVVKVHGWCVGGGSEYALLGDIVIASEDAQFGTPYSRVWGCHLTGMWVYRLGLAKAKHYALTGRSISGKEAAEIGLINFAYPQDQLDDKVREYVDQLAQIPVTQLAAMKFITNQVYDRLGVQHTSMIGPVFDMVMRNTHEAHEFVRVAKEQGVGAAVARRDGPFGDYSQGGPDSKPKT
jgi:enoyl-CoA hydratase